MRTRQLLGCCAPAPEHSHFQRTKLALNGRADENTVGCQPMRQISPISGTKLDLDLGWRPLRKDMQTNAVSLDRQEPHIKNGPSSCVQAVNLARVWSAHTRDFQVDGVFEGYDSDRSVTLGKHTVSDPAGAGPVPA